MNDSGQYGGGNDLLGSSSLNVSVASSEIAGHNHSEDAHVNPHRCGMLMKKSGSVVWSRWQTRWFVLDGLTVRYYKNVGQAAQRGQIRLQNAEVGSDETGVLCGKLKPEYPYGFWVKDTVEERTFKLAASSAEDRAGWIASIRHNIDALGTPEVETATDGTRAAVKEKHKEMELDSLLAQLNDETLFENSADALPEGAPSGWSATFGTHIIPKETSVMSMYNPAVRYTFKSHKYWPLYVDGDESGAGPATDAACGRLRDMHDLEGLRKMLTNAFPYTPFPSLTATGSATVSVGSKLKNMLKGGNSNAVNGLTEAQSEDLQLVALNQFIQYCAMHPGVSVHPIMTAFLRSYDQWQDFLRTEFNASDFPECDRVPKPPSLAREQYDAWIRAVSKWTELAKSGLEKFGEQLEARAVRFEKIAAAEQTLGSSTKESAVAWKVLLENGDAEIDHQTLTFSERTERSAATLREWASAEISDDVLGTVLFHSGLAKSIATETLGALYAAHRVYASHLVAIEDADVKTAALEKTKSDPKTVAKLTALEKTKSESMNEVERLRPEIETLRKDAKKEFNRAVQLFQTDMENVLQKLNTIRRRYGGEMVSIWKS